MTDIRVSVIIPVYGVECYVERCIRSVMAQTFNEPFECIIVNDCSPDGSIGVVERLLADNETSVDFHIVHHERNRGLAAARNTGMAYAKGDYVFHLDSDDFIEPDTLDSLYRAAVETEADIVVADYFLTYGKRDIRQYLRIPDTREGILSALITGKMPETVARANLNKLIKKTLYVENEIKYVEGVDYNEDLLVMLPLCFHARKIVKLDKALGHYVQTNGTSLTKKISQKNIRNKLRANEIISDFLIAHHLESLTDALNQKKMQDWLYALIGSHGEEQKAYLHVYPELDAEFNRYARILPLYWRIPALLARRGQLGTFNVCRTVLLWVKRVIKHY